MRWLTIRPPYLRARRLRPAVAALAVSAVTFALAAPAHAGSGGGGLGGPGTPGGGTKTNGSSAAGPAPKPGQVVISGHGAGHGVGMSQYGAEGYALHGFSDTEILAHYYTGTALGHVSPTEPVRVLLADGRASFTGAQAAGSTTLSPAQTYDVTALAGQLTIVNASTQRRVVSLPSPVIVTGHGSLRTGGRAYRGALQFSADGTGGVRTVNVVGLDDYVRGVVGPEMSPGWAPAALEAQAIAARTYAITTTVKGPGYQLLDDTRSQMYGGVAVETATTDAAVAATAGQVVTDGGAPVTTYFFSSSGGETESIQNVWAGSPPEPWLVGVADPYDAAAHNPDHSWHLTMSVAAATAKLGSLVRGRLQRVTVTRHGVSPRIITAQVRGTHGTTTVTGSQLAAAFGTPSTWMSFAVGR